MIRQAAWRGVGRAARSAAVGASVRRYYAAVTGSLVRSLARLPAVRAVYGHGSYAAGSFTPGASDVDLVVAVDDLPVAEEVELLAALRRRYAGRGSILPIDLTVLPLWEFGRSAAWHAFRRVRIQQGGSETTPADWLLLAGEDVRSEDGWAPDPRLAYLTDTPVHEALAACTRARRAGRAVAARLWELDEHASREGLGWFSACELARAREQLLDGRGGAAAAVSAIGSALDLVDEHRRRRSVPVARRPLDTDGWEVERPGTPAVGAARRVLAGLDGRARRTVRSATVYRPPFQAGEILLLECQDGAAARQTLAWAVETGAAEAAREGLRLHVLTSRLAEGLWRSAGLRWAPLAGGGAHLAGDPLGPRVGLPDERFVRQLSRFYGVFGIAGVRGWLAGRRKGDRGSIVPLLAARRAIAAGELPVTVPEALARRVPQLAAAGPIERLDLRSWAALALELWYGWPAWESVESPVAPPVRR